MEDVEFQSWWFVHRIWPRIRRQPIPDKGFENTFREYLYSQIEFDGVSDVRDMGMGLSYSTLSENPHELDVICFKDREMHIFELKHYEESEIGKEIVFTFLGKVTDFYLKNVETLSHFRMTMYLVTVKESIDDAIRKLCITFGIKLIEPGRMTLHILNYFTRDLYEKLRDGDELKDEVAKIVENVGKVVEQYDYSYSDIFRYKDSKVEIEMPPPLGPTIAVEKIWELSQSFEAAFGKWKPQTRS